MTRDAKGGSEIVVHVADEQNALSIDASYIIDVVRNTLQSEGVERADISVALIDDVTMHELNRRHLDHDYPTDVLSFLLEESDDRIEGEIVISTDTAIREGTAYGWGGVEEATLYLVHGLLHLCGYDDHSEEDLREMRERERSVLKNWSLSPHYDG
ncbi:MAG: rRNA maturation RNase YbeY [Planctomycetaceae bacterium]